jgi:Salmonella virulence plasmid 65kDa B protein
VVADPARADRVFAWKETRTEDPFGNRIEWLYEPDIGRAHGHHWSQTYLKAVRYGDYGEDADRRFLVEVRFHYEQRPDPFSDRRAAFEVRTTRRCTSIEIWTHADTAFLLIAALDVT